MLHKLWFALSLFFTSLAIGIIGYMLIENYSVSEAFYMSVITFSTVGFQEVHPLHEGGRIFTGFYIIVNLGIFAYIISVVSTYIFEGELRKAFKNFLIGREVKKMKNHIIICGFGRNGAKAAELLYKEGKRFVVIEQNSETINSHPGNEKYQFVQGDATNEDVLLEAGLERASIVITALPKDTDNVFITLTVKEMNPHAYIIARSSELHSEKKLIRAGANKVVMPDLLGGAHMAQLITKPYVIEFLELLNGMSDDNDLNLEEVSFDDLNEEVKGISLGEMDVRKKTGASIMAYKEGDIAFKFNPPASKVFKEKDIIILLGTDESIDNFKKEFCKKGL